MGATPRERLSESAEPELKEADLPVLADLMGYQARRAALHIIARFHEDLKNLSLRPVTFSVLSVVGHHDGLTSREVCDLLGIQPPNLVAIIQDLQQRGWLDRQPHPTDGRALGLHLTPQGQAQLAQAEALAVASDQQVCGHLSPAERETLVRLLKKIRTS
jgi:DNA-binding MarR family transcriptional regulator